MDCEVSHPLLPGLEASTMKYAIRHRPSRLEESVAKKVMNPAASEAKTNGTAQQDGTASRGALVADIIIANAPDPVFVSDLEGKILQANDAVSQLLGFRKDEVVEQSLSRFISPEETREFMAALDEVVERGVTRNAVLNPRSAAGEVIPTSLNASALRDADGKVIGAIGILRDMRELDKARAYAQRLIDDAPDPVFVSDLEGKIIQANEAVSGLLGFRQDEVVEQSLSRFISPEETREFTAALREVVEHGVTRNARLNPRSASGEVIPTTLDAAALRAQVESLQRRVELAEERRRALVHIMGDLNKSNQKLADQRKAMLHILGDYEDDRSRLARQTERLDNSRRALLHILKDSHESNLRLGDSRKAMIHIMGDLRETTQEMERREHELRDKQEQLVQAGKLATLGELTTGVAHELNNPLNNIGLYVGNVIDRIRLGADDAEPLVSDLEKAMEQVRKATDIISHLRTFGRAARVSIEQVDVDDVIE